MIGGGDRFRVMMILELGGVVFLGGRIFDMHKTGRLGILPRAGRLISHTDNIQLVIQC